MTHDQIQPPRLLVTNQHPTSRQDREDPQDQRHVGEEFDVEEPLRRAELGEIAEEGLHLPRVEGEKVIQPVLLVGEGRVEGKHHQAKQKERQPPSDDLTPVALQLIAQDGEHDQASS